MIYHLVGEHFPAVEVISVRNNGGGRRENVGTSNRKSDEISDHRKPKVSLAMNISQGLGGPNLDAPTGSGDGQLVNIPTLLYISEE